MLKFLKLIYGYVIILVRGENLERFLNLCKSRKVYMEKIRYREDGQLMAQMQAADFFRLRPLRNKTGVHIQIIVHNDADHHHRPASFPSSGFCHN